MHALIENGVVKRYPYTAAELKKAHPEDSFPEVPSDEALLGYGVHRVYFSTPLPFDPITENLVENSPVFDSQKKSWVQAWEVRPKTQEEISQITAEQKAQVRAMRNRLLAECDWTQMPDAPVDRTPWTAYRQALRDITAQEGFPFNVQWPVAPQ